MKRILCILFVAFCFLVGCTAQPEVPSGSAVQTSEPTENIETQKEAHELVSGKYCVLGVDGERTYPEWTALKFDFENSRFDFGLPNTDSSWIRRGELTVEGNRIMAISNRQKTTYEGSELKILGFYTWLFELETDGSIRYLPDGSDEFDIYGTQLNAESVLILVDELEKPLD